MDEVIIFDYSFKLIPANCETWNKVKENEENKTNY